MTALLFALLGAFVNRVRGGFLPTGHAQIARAIYAVSFGAMSFLHTWNGRLALALAPALFVGAILGSNDWGLLESWRDAREGVISGLANVALGVLAAFFLAGFTYAGAIAAAGLMKLPLYFLAVKVIRSPVKYLAGGELGEALYGAAIGLALSA